MSSSLTLRNKMPTSISNLSTYDAGSATEEGGIRGWCSVHSVRVAPLSHLPLPMNVKLALSELIRGATCVGVLPIHGGMYVAFPSSEAHLRL